MSFIIIILIVSRKENQKILFKIILHSIANNIVKMFAADCSFLGFLNAGNDNNKYLY